MDVSERFKDWWAHQPEVEKVRLIKEKSMQLNKNYKSLKKASQAEMEYGLNRIGTRGGKFTSLCANSERYARAYYSGLDELKYMVLKI